MKSEFVAENKDGITTITREEYIGRSWDGKAQHRTDIVLQGAGRFVVAVGSGGNFCGLAGGVVEIPENTQSQSDELPGWSRTEQTMGGPRLQTFWPVSIHETRAAAELELTKQISGSAPDFRGVEEVLNSGMVIRV